MSKRVWLLTTLIAVLGLADLYLALIWSPQEAKMGDLVRIMYFHVASAWIAFLAFFVTFVFSLLYLARKRLFFDAVAVCSAEIGIVYTTITLATGAMWAKPIWNTWWTWDPRLTTTLILWFLFIGYLLLRGTIQGLERRARFSSVYAIIACVDIPIIHLSVQLWRSIHPDLINDTGFHMPGAMTVTLLFGFFTFVCWYVLLLYMRVGTELARIRLHQARTALRAVQSRQSQA